MITFLDFETTGFMKEYSQDPEDQPGIVQIGAVKTDLKGNVIDEFNELIDPDLKDPSQWREDAMEVSGIFPENVKGKPTFHTVLPRFARFCLGSIYFVGYNHEKFDNPVLEWQLKRYGFEYNFPWPLFHIDMMPHAAEHFNMLGKQGRKNPKLVEIYEELTGKEMENAHNALFDVYGTREIFTQLGGLEGLGFAQQPSC